MGRPFKKKSITAESSFLTPMDRRVYSCIKQNGDKLIQSNVVKNCMKKALGVTFEEYDEEGNKLSEVSVAQKIVNATLEDAIINPDTRKLKDIANIVGELKENNNNTNVNIISPVEMFKGIGFGEEVIEANFRDKEM